MLSYKNQLSTLEANKPGTNWILIIIAVILGLLLGLMFK
jgi:hypothetical protein